jgi:hypothetical protein
MQTRMSSSTKISGVFLACLKSSMDFRSSSLFSSFLYVVIIQKKASEVNGSFCIFN